MTDDLLRLAETGVPIDPVKWLEACEAYREGLSENAAKEESFHRMRYQLWPHLMGADGRLHPRWAPTAWTGRVHAVAPAVQQIPKALRVGIASPGKLILCCDWAASHPRILAQVSGDQQLRCDLHGTDAYLPLAEQLAAIDGSVEIGVARKATKKVVNTLLNGGGTGRIEEILREHSISASPKAVLGSVIKRWQTAFRHIRKITVDAERAGWNIELPSGATVMLPEDDRSAHKIASGYLQGIEVEALLSVAAIATQLEEKGIARLIILHHDETIWEVEPCGAAKALEIIPQVMGRALCGQSDLARIAANATIGPSWGEQGEPTQIAEVKPHHGEIRNRSAWVAEGLRTIRSVADAEAPKAKAVEVSRDREKRFAVEAAAVHSKSDTDLSLREVTATSGGRDAAAVLRAITRQAKAIEDFIARATARKESDCQPALERGDHVELANAVLRDIGGICPEGQPTGTVVFDEGSVWSFDEATGLWMPVSEVDVRCKVHALAGTAVGSGKHRRQLKISKGDGVGATSVLQDRTTEAGFFGAHRPIGAPMANGLVLPDGVCRDYTRDDRVRNTEVSLARYDTSAGCPRWMQYLDEVFGSDEDATEKIMLLQEFAGAVLFGVATKLAKALVLHGGGRNGKSVYLHVVSMLVHPSAVTAITPQRLTGDKGEYYAARLARSRLNAVSEMPEREVLDSEIVKAAISGDVDTITGRDPGGRPFEFHARAAWVINANRLPPVRDTSDGYWRRMLVVQFRRKFLEADADTSLGEKLQAEIEGIANWAIEGGRRLLQQGRYTVPATSVTAVDDWRTEASSIAVFVREHVRVRTTGRVWANDLYRTYSEWCRDHGHKPVSATRFGREMKDTHNIPNGKTGKHWYGVEIVDDWRDLHDLNRMTETEMASLIDFN